MIRVEGSLASSSVILALAVAAVAWTGWRGELGDYWAGAAGGGSAMAVAALLAAVRRRRRAAAAARARREALVRQLMAACAASPEPLRPADRGLLDCARTALRHAQMLLSDRGEVDAAASVLDERVRLERLIRSVDFAGGEFDAAALFSPRPRPRPTAPPPADGLAEEIVRQAMSVEAAADKRPAELPDCLENLREACQGLLASLDAGRPSAYLIRGPSGIV